MREGIACDRHPGTGCFYLCLGPGSSLPGPRLQVVIYDANDQVVRRLEQIRGACLDEGFVSFFAGDPRSRPARYAYPLVDIDPDGKKAILVDDYPRTFGPSLFHEVLARWVGQYGVPHAATISL